MLLIVNNDSGTTDDLTNALDAIGASYELINSDQSITLKRLKSYSGFIFSGGPWDLTKPQLFSEFKLDIQVLVNTLAPILGICMGHQILSEANGADISQWDKIRHATRMVEILITDDLFKGLPDKIKVLEWHQEWVVATPPGFSLLATGLDPLSCKIQAIKHHERPIYGTQFHPELSGEVGLHILRNFLSICGEE